MHRPKEVEDVRYTTTTTSYKGMLYLCEQWLMRLNIHVVSITSALLLLGEEIHPFPQKILLNISGDIFSHLCQLIHARAKHPYGVTDKECAES